jgi:peptidoglycan/xylan/chitin deacetylase (PgdA/CDA1 family)
MEYFIAAALCVVIVVILYFWKKQSMKNGLRIFMYHHIGHEDDTDNKETFFVNIETFAQQLDLLAKNYHVMSLAEVEDHYINNMKLPKGAVLLTFDDGYLNNYTYAYPLVQEKKLPITIFLTTGEISAKREMLTWKQVAEMKQSNLVSFASHGVNHTRLRKLSDEDVLFELTESKTELEEQLGQPVRSFCYPYGAFDSRVRELVFQAGYIMDFGTRKGITHWPWNAKRPLKRAHVMRGENIFDFQNQLNTGWKKGIMNWLF